MRVQTPSAPASDHAARNRETLENQRATLNKLTGHAERMLPALRDRAPRCEEIRRLPDETFQELIAGGFFRIFQPARYGGYELEPGHPQIEIAGRFGRACGSTAWVWAVVACHSWLIGMYPLQAQDDVWRDTPDAVAATASFPEKSRFEKVTGGYRISARCKFASGVDHADWVVVGIPFKTETGAPDSLWCLVPKRDLEVIDTWFVSGLRGTGSKDIQMEGVFVPEHRVLPLSEMVKGTGPGTAVNPSHIYRIPLFAAYTYNLVTPALGIARGAIDDYCDRMRARGVGVVGLDYSSLESIHLKISEAAVQVDCAVSLLKAMATEFNAQVYAGDTLRKDQIARARRNFSYASQLCMQAVDSIHYVGGAHSIFEDNSMPRAFRDIHALNAQFALKFHLAARAYGRLAIGLDSGDPFI